MPVNAAAWLVSDRANPLEVKPAPYTSPSTHEIVVQTHAVSINPVDGAIQRVGSTFHLFSHVPYPWILGTDLAGEVVEVGSSVTRFKVGDRVVGLGQAFGTGETSRGTFQKYVVVDANTAALVPSHISFEAACVLPLALTTAASGMFHEESLGLPLPSLNPKPTGQTLVIWGGATSVGACAIQLAVASGYEVISTASPKNFDAVKKLGAKAVFDYKSESVVTDIIDALQDQTIAGCMAISNHWLPSLHDAGEACAEIAAKSKGHKFVATGGPAPKELPEGVTAKFINGGALQDHHRQALFGGFLGPALAEGKFVPAPPPLVVGKGLENIQPAIDRLAQGVSFQKVVVTLEE